ncbi:hypothetical protein M2T82_01540 [Elizabethkingia ursingii]|uniref:hypothetical protein n=1 Tax=Elizabethkingia ursingii TaxID=1756150 RepID=UPI002012B3DD|nr:hypothetical protein [Elizabethkingia ursingii]MCL1666736.1 hypothetical protein [Elizabethkingia ursingii]
MNKIVPVALLFLNFCYAQVMPTVSKEKITVSQYRKVSLLDTIRYKPQFSVSIKPVSKDNGLFPQGKIYRDNFTGRTYFQSGFDRTQVYPKNHVIATQEVDK